MRTYVLGAGASYPIYPLGSSLLECIDRFIRSCGKCVDRFDYEKEWPAKLQWLAENSNPLLREAYRGGNIEQILTILDFAQSLHEESLVSILRASKAGLAAVSDAERSYASLDAELTDYKDARRILMWATEAYLQHRHEGDRMLCRGDDWAALGMFAEKLQPGDIVITFNYDATIERVLFAQQKWFPKDGYGTELVFQKSRHDATRVEFPRSPVKVLHLHGAIGWYKKPHFREDFALTDEGGAVPREALTPAPLDTEISLDPLFLRGLGISEVDASMPTRPSHEYQTLLHPSFLKDYTGSDNGTEIYRRLWKMASEALRAAERVAIVGYSLPPADTASWALFVSSCNGRSTDIVDPSRSVMARYRRMLRLPILRPPVSFQEWVKTF